MAKAFKQRKTLGLALGSGGWRGQAHVGIIKALEAAGIKINYIAGSSTGSLVGGAYCALNNAGDLEEIFKEELNSRMIRKVFSDPRLRWGMFKGQKVTKLFEDLIGRKNIEDLRIPFCALSTDLLTGKILEIKEGSLSKAVRASTSIPFIFQPVVRGRARLIDGATAVPVPVKTVRQMGADVVIAVNLYKNIFPIHAKKMNPLGAALKTSHVMLYHLAKYSCQNADLVLEPDLKENKNYTNPFSFAKNKSAIEIGENTVNENLEQIKKLLS